MKKLTILFTAIFALAMTQSARAEHPRFFGGFTIFFGNPDTYYYDGHAPGHHYRYHQNNHWKKHRYFVDGCHYCHHWRDYHYRSHPPGHAYGRYKHRGKHYRKGYDRDYDDDYRGYRGRGRYYRAHRHD